MKVLASILLLVFAGCSSTCKDGTNWYAGGAGGYQYVECGMGCLEGEAPKKCKCSQQCSCHKKHGTTSATAP